MNPQTTQVDDLRLLAVPSALNCAEMFVQFALAEWSLRPLIGETTQIARELVAAVIAGVGQSTTSCLIIRLRLDGACLVVEVEDEYPMSQVTVPASLAGRRTGAVSIHGGTLIWCEVPLPAGQTASSVPLPRRERRRPPAGSEPAGEMAEVDPQVIERILTRLNRSPE